MIIHNISNQKINYNIYLCGFTPTRGTRRMTTSVLELDGKVVLLASSERGLYRRVPLFGVTWLARRPVPNSDEGLNSL